MRPMLSEEEYCEWAASSAAQHSQYNWIKAESPTVTISMASTKYFFFVFLLNKLFGWSDSVPLFGYRIRSYFLISGILVAFFVFVKMLG